MDEHIQRHELLHRYLDELVADFIANQSEFKGLSKTSIMELMQWSAEQTKKPDTDRSTE